MSDGEHERAQGVVVAVKTSESLENGEEHLAGHVVGFAGAAPAQVAVDGGRVSLPDLGQRPGLSLPRRDHEVALARVRTGRAHDLSTDRRHQWFRLWLPGAGA